MIAPSPNSTDSSKCPRSRFVTSTNSLKFLGRCADRSWLESPSAWNHFCSVLTSLYALFIIVFAAVVELSQKFTPDEWTSETMFYSYMYGAGLIFLIYCYLLQSTWLKKVLHLTPYMGEKMRVPHSYSLYLRLGTLCFGSSGIVLFCLEVFMCLSDNRCFNYQLANWMFAAFFTFTQMHFVFCNSKVLIDSKSLAKLGTMHLLAVNIWTWLRFVVAKNTALDRASIEKKLARLLNESGHINQTVVNHTVMVTVEKSRFVHATKVISFNYFGDFATLLTTCIVEYSVIAAAIMATLWRSIDDNSDFNARCESLTVAPGDSPTKKRHSKSVRIDCSASSGGLFAGLLFLIGALVSIGIHSFFSQHSDSHGALLVFRLSDMALFCFTLIACSVGLYRMRVLQYYYQRSKSNAEFLDEILLVIGLIGELIHSSTGIMCWISTQTELAPVRMEFYMLFVFITRIVQVVVQAVFILLARRLRTLSQKSIHDKPGKQFVTFLLIANVSLFVFHTLEGMKSVFGATIATRRSRPYAALIVAVGPLVVFYRFHSSVCLAEIWKNCYSLKKVDSSLESKFAIMPSVRKDSSESNETKSVPTTPSNSSTVSFGLGSISSAGSISGLPR